MSLGITQGTRHSAQAESLLDLPPCRKEEAVRAIHSHCLAAMQGCFHLYTGHNNLILIFEPLSIFQDFSNLIVRRMLRWAVLLSIYNYVCPGISGNDNVWADLLERWAAQSILQLMISVSMPLATSLKSFEGSSGSVLRIAEQQHSAPRQSHSQETTGLWPPNVWGRLGPCSIFVLAAPSWHHHAC